MPDADVAPRRVGAQKVSRYDTIVIGAGHNGLVAAAYLAKAGQKVLVLERRDLVGGAAATEELFPGYRVDSGAHRVGGLSDEVVRELGLAAHGLELVASEATCFTPAESGPPLTLWRDRARSAASIREISAADADAWEPFTELVAKAAGLMAEVWRMTPPDVTGNDPRDLAAGARLGLGLRRLGRRDMAEVMRILPMSIYELLDEWFESDLVRGTIAASAVAGLCQGPMAAGTVATFLHHHVGAGRGVIRPTVRVRGGIGRLSEALGAACGDLGVEIRTGAGVERVLVQEGAAVGVAVDGGDEVQAARVVSSLDARATFFGLLGPTDLGVEFGRKVEAIRYRGITAKVHLALGGLPDFTCLRGGGPELEGVVSISPSLEYVERAYDAAKYGGVSERPSLELSIPSLTDSAVAPEGKHLASVVMQYAAYDRREGVWDERARGELLDTVIATLSRYAPGIEALVEDRQVLTPLDLEHRFGLTEGNIYHGEMTLDQLLFMRPVPGASRYRAPLPGLYLCGSGTHPGGGVTGVPGRNAAREILRD